MNVSCSKAREKNKNRQVCLFLFLNFMLTLLKSFAYMLPPEVYERLAFPNLSP